MSASAQCPHSQVHWHLHHQAFEEATIRYLEVTGVCELCGETATFRGMPVGMSPHQPTMAADGGEARLPFMFGDEEPTGNLISVIGSAQ